MKVSLGLKAVVLFVICIAATLAAAGQFTAFGPEVEVRQSGVQTITRQFSVLNPATSYTLRLKNGSMVDDQYEPVANTQITLNGVVVVAPKEFTQVTTQLDKPVQLQATNQLVIELRGRLGGAMSVEVIGDDNDLPVITATASPGANTSGWNNTDVTVSFTCSDATSGVSSCNSPITVSADGASQTISGTAVDHAGNTATASVTLSIDKTPPTITASVSPAPDANGTVPIGSTVSFTCDDALSGIAVCAQPISLESAGTNISVSGTAVDNAGNTGTAQLIATVVNPVPIVTSISPQSGPAGTEVTIVGQNFGSAQGSSSVAFNGSSAVVSTWSDTQIVAVVPNGAISGPVVVTVNGQLSNGIDFALPPVLASLSPVRGGAGTRVVISGSNFGDSPGIVTFGSSTALVLSWTSSQIEVEVPDLFAGTTDVRVLALGFQSNPISFTVTEPLLISPNEVTLLLGQSRGFQILDADGSELQGAVWRSEDPSVADNSEGGTGITAKGLGETKVHAFIDDRSGTLSITVIDVGDSRIPPGTVEWSSPPLATGFVSKIAQARVVDDSVPDFYVEESDWNFRRLRAFDADGRQRWVWPGYAQLIAADNKGGAIAITLENFAPKLTSITQDGIAGWSIPADRLSSFRYAVHPDGTIFFVRFDQNAENAYLVAFDGATGVEKGSIQIPSTTKTTTGTSLYFNSITNRWYNICDPSASNTTSTVPSVGNVVVGSDGFAYVSFAYRESVYSANCQPQFDSHNQPWEWSGQSTSPYSYTTSVGVVRMSSSGGASIQTVDSSSGSGTNWSTLLPTFGVFSRAIISNGTAEMIFSATKPGGSPVLYSTTGRQWTAPFSVDSMLMGSKNVLYISQDPAFGGQTAALALDTSELQWQIPKASHLLAALADGGVFAESGTISKIDAAGESMGIIGGYPTFASNYYFGDQWATSGVGGGLTLVAGGLLDPPTVETFPGWSLSGTDWDQDGGNSQKQNSPAHTISFRTYRVEPVTVEFIEARVQHAIQYWSYYGLKLKWDRTVIPQSQCMGTPDCSPGNPSYLLDFPFAQDYRDWIQTVLQVFPQKTGIDLFFIATVQGSEQSPGTARDPDTGVHLNKIFMPRNSWDRLAHEVGHALQEEHVVDPFNLMCSDELFNLFECSTVQGNSFTRTDFLYRSQWKRMMKNAEKLYDPQ